VTANLRVLIVDDEEPARALLREFLEREPGVEIVAEAGDGFEAVRVATETAPDVAFLDIEMPRLTGFEVAELLAREVAVVFVTAYDRYALQAFEIHAVDYVLKPFQAERLREALSRARIRRSTGRTVDPAAVAAAARPQGAWADRIVVRDGSRVHVIAVDRIDALEAQDDYVAVVTGGKKFLKPQTLASLSASLDPSRFLRVHRSYLVNLDRLERIELYAKNSHVAVLAGGLKIPVSREGYARLKAILDAR
jgi:two-component system LytT family response regulator